GVNKPNTETNKQTNINPCTSFWKKWEMVYHLHLQGFNGSLIEGCEKIVKVCYLCCDLCIVLYIPLRYPVTGALWLHTPLRQTPILAWACPWCFAVLDGSQQ